MKTLPLLLLCLLPTAGAMAQETSTPLDLSLPQGSVAGTTPFAADPPGTYYGDRSGRPAGLPDEDAKAEDPGDDAEIHGSVSTGIGYSSRGGNSHWSAADINISKSYGENKDKKVNVSIGVSQYDGPGFHGAGSYPHPRWDEMPPPGF